MKETLMKALVRGVLTMKTSLIWLLLLVGVPTRPVIFPPLLLFPEGLVGALK